MQRLTEYAAFPLISGALGAAGAFIATTSFGADPLAASTSGLALFAGALALRNWGLSRVERPLLAEELTGLHERMEAVQADAVDLRELLTDLAAIVEEASAREHEALRNVAARLRALEAEATPAESEALDIGAALAPLEERLAQFEARTRKLALAMETAFGAENLAGRDGLSEDGPESEDGLESTGEALPTDGTGGADAALQEERRDGPQDRLRAAAARLRREPPIAPARPSQPIAETLAPETPAREAPIAETPIAESAQPDRVTADPTPPLLWNQQTGAASWRDADPVEAAAEERSPEPEARPRAPAAAAPAPAPKRAVAEAGAFDEAARAGAREHALLMQAVFSVPDGEPRFFEAYTRRYDADGQVLPEASHIEAAKADGTIGAVDNLLLVRSVAAAEQLRAAGRDVAIFCNLSAHSLRDPTYLRTLIAFLRKNQALARNLVFEFSQLDLAEAFDPDVAALQRLRETGFAFSIDHLSDWSIDIAHLAKIGFRYVKLDAESLLARERAAPGATKRLIKSLDRAGLTLVVEKVETLEDIALLRDAGAELLQGRALAEPRVIEVEDEDFLTLETAARQAMAAGGGLHDAEAGRIGEHGPAAPFGGFDAAAAERSLRPMSGFSSNGASAHSRPD